MRDETEEATPYQAALPPAPDGHRQAGSISHPSPDPRLCATADPRVRSLRATHVTQGATPSCSPPKCARTSARAVLDFSLEKASTASESCRIPTFQCLPAGNEHHDLHEKAPPVKHSFRASLGIVDQVTLPFASLSEGVVLHASVQVGVRPVWALQSQRRPSRKTSKPRLFDRPECSFAVTRTGQLGGSRCSTILQSAYAFQ